jgi:hypothetical protein
MLASLDSFPAGEVSAVLSCEQPAAKNAASAQALGTAKKARFIRCTVPRGVPACR